jgi:hypothetical protein
MVSPRSGKALEADRDNKRVNKPQTTISQQKPNVGKKRKAEDEIPEEDNKENIERPSTPPPTESGESELAHLPSYERTPGRVGPIKPENFDVSPDIKPFKGPPGKKVRKTAREKDEEYKQFVRENKDHVFHE